MPLFSKSFISKLRLFTTLETQYIKLPKKLYVNGPNGTVKMYPATISCNM